MRTYAERQARRNCWLEANGAEKAPSWKRRRVDVPAEASGIRLEAEGLKKSEHLDIPWTVCVTSKTPSAMSYLDTLDLTLWGQVKRDMVQFVRAIKAGKGD